MGALARALLPGAIPVLALGVRLHAAIPGDRYPSVSIRPDEAGLLALYLATRLSFACLLCAAAVLAVARLVASGRRAAAGALLAALQGALLLPALCGDGAFVRAWRWPVLGLALAAAAAWPALVGPRPRRAVGAACAAAWLAAVAALFGLIGRAEGYPALSWLVVFWIHGAGFVAATALTSARPDPPDPPGRRAAAALLRRLGNAATIGLVAAALLAPWWTGPHVRFARVRFLVAYHLRGPDGLVQAGLAARREWIKVRGALLPGRRVLGSVGAGELPASARPASRRHVIWLVIDALRRDHAGAYGARGATTPHLDRLAARATLYARAYSPAPGTGQSLGSALTGLTPMALAALDRTPLTMPAALAAFGWRTAAGRTAEDLQLFVYPVFADRTFADLGVSRVTVPATRVGGGGRAGVARADAAQVAALLDDLRAGAAGAAGADAPQFHYVHLMQTHGPFRGRGGPRRYRKAIARADALLGRVLDRLDADNLWERTVLVVFGDHGEALGEHGMWGHSQALYEEQVAVPLVVHVPGRPPGREAGLVTLSDLPAITFQALGAAWPFGAPESRPPGVAVGELKLQHELIWRSVRLGDLVLHRRLLDGRDELFDLRSDPGELDDLAPSAPDRLAELLRVEERVVEWEARQVAAVRERGPP